MDLYPTGKFEQWLRDDRRAPPSSFVSADEKAIRDRIFRESGGYRAPAMWYKMLTGNIGVGEEIADEVDVKLKCPVLMVWAKVNEGSKGLGRPDFSTLAEDVRMKEVSTSGHWVQLEAREEVNGMLEEFWGEVELRYG